MTKSSNSRKAHYSYCVNMASGRDTNTYQTHHNLTTADEGDSTFGYANGWPLNQCDFQMQTCDPDGHMIMLSIDSPHFDPMMYVLFYPYGTLGGSLILRLNTVVMVGQNKHVSQCCKGKWISHLSWSLKAFLACRKALSAVENIFKQTHT